MGEVLGVKSLSLGLSMGGGVGFPLPFCHLPNQDRWGQTEGEGDFNLQGTLGNVGRHFWFYWWGVGATGI